MDPLASDPIPSPLTPILRHDGSLRYDLLTRVRFEQILTPQTLEDPAIAMIMKLCDQGVFHPLIELFGNIGLDRFSQSRLAIGKVVAHAGFARSPYATILKRALLKTVKSLQDREPKARSAEHLIAQPEAIEQLAREVLSLEARCANAGNARRQHSSCRMDYWRLWEMAWAVRIFDPNEKVIETLEKIYQRFTFLELREGERRRLQLPGGLRDPRLQEEIIELW
ncbi:MAG: hypothetical protein HQM03_19125 [Magnetococcales bacterium]|nr:hypothetical protein [Magnetococcales bacterium]